MEPKEHRDTRLYIRVTPEFYDKFRYWADRLGVTLNQFGNMCVQAGISSIIRAISPEDAFTPDQIVAIIKAAEKQGLQLDFTDLAAKKENGQQP